MEKKTQERLLGEQKKPNNPTPAASSITVNVITAFVQAAVELPRSSMYFNHSNREGGEFKW